MRASPLVRLAPALVLLSLVTAALPATAEWGHYGEDAWPVNVDGETTDPGRPFPGMRTEPDLGLGPLNEVAGVTVYPYYPVLTAEVQRLADEHPDLVKLHSAGKSALGLDLWMLEIADFGNPDMKPLDEREVVWVDGGTHSNEYSGVYFVTHLASFLADGYGNNETATWIVENRHTWIMPLVNPDGSHAFGRLNAHAVNINRNYPVIWGAVAENPLFNNPGPAPASEPETRVNIAWFNKTRPDLYVSVHCCGNLWLYPYGVDGMDPVDKPVFERVCDDAFPTVREDCGPIWSTIYPASGSSVDTVYEYTGAIAWGYEMSGRGAVALWGQPFTTESVRAQEVESWEGLLHGFLNVHRYGALPVVDAVARDGKDVLVSVVNDGYGNITRGNLTLLVSGSDAGGGRLVDLPPLAPGERAAVRVVDVPNGEGTLALEYVKREMAAPEGVATLPVAVTAKAVTVPGVTEDAGLVKLAGGGLLDVPAAGAPLAAVLALVAALVLARRVRV